MTLQSLEQGAITDIPQANCIAVGGRQCLSIRREGDPGYAETLQSLEQGAITDIPQANCILVGQHQYVSIRREGNIRSRRSRNCRTLQSLEQGALADIP